MSEDTKTEEQELPPTDPKILAAVEKFKNLREEIQKDGLDFFILTNLGGEAVLPIDLFPVLVMKPEEVDAPNWMINMSFHTMQKTKAKAMAEAPLIIPANALPKVPRVG